jgi:hypothetical protein
MGLDSEDPISVETHSSILQDAWNEDARIKPYPAKLDRRAVSTHGLTLKGRSPQTGTSSWGASGRWISESQRRPFEDVGLHTCFNAILHRELDKIVQ